MLKDSYKILGVDEYATDREISEAYFALRKKYLEERFAEGEKGNEAAKMLTKIDGAYDEITRYRRERSGDSQSYSLYKEVDTALKSNDLQKAQSLLDSFDERTAEWHYLQSVVFYKKDWVNECKKQLEIAMNLEPENTKYKQTYERLNSKINAQKASYSQGQSAQGNKSAQGHPQGNFDEPQMGGDSCGEFCCRLAICNICLNCCCNCR